VDPKRRRTPRGSSGFEKISGSEKGGKHPAERSRAKHKTRKKIRRKNLTVGANPDCQQKDSLRNEKGCLRGKGGAGTAGHSRRAAAEAEATREGPQGTAPLENIRKLTVKSMEKVGRVGKRRKVATKEAG